MKILMFIVVHKYGYALLISSIIRARMKKIDENPNPNPNHEKIMPKTLNLALNLLHDVRVQERHRV